MKNRIGAMYIEYILTFLVAGLAIVAGIHFISIAAESRAEQSNTVKETISPCQGAFSDSSDATSSACF